LGRKGSACSGWSSGEGGRAGPRDEIQERRRDEEGGGGGGRGGGESKMLMVSGDGDDLSEKKRDPMWILLLWVYPLR